MMQMMTRKAIDPLKMAAAVGAALLVWGLLLAYNTSPARAADGCSTTAGITTCTFASTGSEQTFVVPDEVSTVHVVATGAPGSLGDFGNSAGRGAQVSGDLTGLVAGQTLYVNVGGAPTGVKGESGGFNGGGSSGHYGGGGGGASDVRTVSRSGDPLESLASRLIVAGGGGGSGTNQGCELPDGSNEFLTGGAGGDAGKDGGDGEPCGSLAGGTGGKAGTQSEGGLGGSPEGQSGSLGQGGGAVLFGGGGGGGSYAGGGGGDQTSAGSSDAAAGGGGGGSSLVPPTGGSGPIITSAGPSITISYTESNRPPVATDDALATDEDTAGTVDVLANDTDADGDALRITSVGTPSHGAAAIDDNGTPTNTADDRIDYDPAADYNGADSFTYTISDGRGGTHTGTVTVTVKPVNDAPSFTAGADQTVDEDAGAQSVAWATQISAGPNETDQKVDFIVDNDNPSLFSVQPVISADGTLSYTPAPDANGGATVSVRLHDDGGLDNGGVNTSDPLTFEITVSAVNDAPTVAVAVGGSCGTNYRSGTINLTVNDPDGQTQTEVLKLNATSNNKTLVPNANVTFGGSGASRTLTATAASGKTGTATITVTVSDGTATGTTALRLQAGGNSNDTLTGTSQTTTLSGTDILLGQNGDDTLRGMGGKDLLCGARGNDRLSGGTEADS